MDRKLPADDAVKHRLASSGLLAEENDHVYAQNDKINKKVYFINCSIECDIYSLDASDTIRNY